MGIVCPDLPSGLLSIPPRNEGIIEPDIPFGGMGLLAFN
jgi:hypothetical protein